jgi:hypothetical protein
MFPNRPLMATLVVIPDNEQSVLTLGAIIQSEFGNKALKLPRGEWLVVFDGTSQQLSDKLKITEGASGTGVVLNFNGYFGRTNKSVWEWIQVNGG